MPAVWCAGQLRIGVFATKNIPKFTAIVLDYNEHSNTYFKSRPSKTRKMDTNKLPLPYIYISVKDQILHKSDDGADINNTNHYHSTVLTHIEEKENNNPINDKPPEAKERIRKPSLSFLVSPKNKKAILTERVIDTSSDSSSDSATTVPLSSNDISMSMSSDDS